MPRPSRNQPCPCGSGVKYKKCCGRDERVARGESVGVLPPPTGPELDPARWIALKATRRPHRVPAAREDPRVVGALLGLWPPPRDRHRPPSDAVYDELVAALVDDEETVHVWLERGVDGREVVVLDVPVELNPAVKRLPGRRFDWRERVWTVPAEPATAAGLLALLDEHPWLTVDPDAEAWLLAAGRWTARVGVWERDGEGVFAVVTETGAAPPVLHERGEAWHEGWLSLPLDAASAALLEGLDGTRLDGLAAEAAEALQAKREVPGAWLELGRDAEGEPRFELRVGWARPERERFLALPEASRLPHHRRDVLFVAQAEALGVPADAALAEGLGAFLAGAPPVAVHEHAAAELERLREERRRAEATVALSLAHDATLDLPPLGGTLEPFQRAGVAYVLQQRRSFLADEQGLGKTVQALAALEADQAFPAAVVCPASLKLNWRREAERWLPTRRVAVVHGRAPEGLDAARADRADLVIVNYDVLDAHADRLAARGLRGAVFDESHYCKEPRAKRTQAALRLANAVAPDGLRLALTGTPILNRPKELVAQLRLVDRLADFGSGAGLGRRFRGADSLERLHWHLRAHGYVRRTKSAVLPQLPAKRVVPLPVELTNEAEYRLAEADVVAWLRSLPLDLRTLEARVAAALRAERLVRLNHLRQLTARGKLRAALAWVDDFLAAGEPLVLFAEHVAVQRAVVERHPAAVHILGDDSAAARDEAVRAFQAPDGPSLIVCSMRAASQGLTLTRASNVAFLELDWTPARHDQAEDRCHRMGQGNAVTAWYLLAPDTIDETMAALLQRKRGVIGAVTDGRAAEDEALVEGVARELRARTTGLATVAA